MSFPNTNPVNIDQIPDELKNRNRWLNWRPEGDGEKPKKKPIVAGTSRAADVTNSSDYSTFQVAWSGAQRPGYGLGFALGEGIVGVDLDDCIDAESMQLKPWAHRIVVALNSYTEVSPSGTGVKVFAFGEVPDARRNGDLEIYGSERYFTVTGLRVQGLAIEPTNRPNELAAVHLLVKAMMPAHRVKVLNHWMGVSQNDGDESKDDFEFCWLLVSHTDDNAIIDKLVRMSGRYRSKWDESRGSESYGELTIRKAREHKTNFSGPRGPSQATLLVDLARTSGAKFFHDAETESYATFQVERNLCQETSRLKSRQFRDWLASKFYRKYATTPGSQALQDAINTLSGIACFESEERPVYVRKAEFNGHIYLDLGDSLRSVAYITDDGWTTLTSEQSPIRFLRPKGLLPLPTPTSNGSIDALRSLLNVENNDDFMLIVAWLVAALGSNGPYPILSLTGEQGSAKSTTARLLRRLIDPQVVPLRAEPRDERDLAISAKNGLIIGYDNLSRIPVWLSDSMCRLASGGGFGTRTLYADDEETLFNFMRPAIFTAISEVAVRGDLLDRALTVNLPAIAAGKRRSEAEIEKAFLEAAPGVLGALLDAVSTGLKNRDLVSFDHLPRMADFALWVEACGLWKRGEFLAAYERNRDSASELAMESTPVADVMRSFFERVSGNAWIGTASELLAKLEEIAPLTAPIGKGWPKAPHVLSGQLRRLAPNLRKLGIEVEVGIRASGGTQRLIRISKAVTP